MKKLNWIVNPLIIFVSIFPLLSLSATLESDSFKVLPYLIKKSPHQVHLRFQSNISNLLLFKNDNFNSMEITTHEEELTTLASSHQKCDQSIKLSLSDNKDNPLYQRTLTPYPCNPEKPFSFAFISDTQ